MKIEPNKTKRFILGGRIDNDVIITFDKMDVEGMTTEEFFLNLEEAMHEQMYVNNIKGREIT